MSSYTYLLIGLIVNISQAELPRIQMDSHSSTWPLDSDIHSGILIFSGLGEDYIRAVNRLQNQDRDCMGEGLEVYLQDGTRRLTVARDTVNTTHRFPDCVNQDIEIVTKAFDQVGAVVNKMLRGQYGEKIDVQQNGQTKTFEEFDSKTHLHLYSKASEAGPEDLALPYHTDNGLYLLITPSSVFPLLGVGQDGTVHKLDTGNNTVILLLGTGLTSWLLGQEGLHSPPHAVPSLPSNSMRSVVARMVVAPPTATPLHDTTSDFWTHFSAPFKSEHGHTLARLRVQRSPADCSQDWPHACTNCANGAELHCSNGQRACWSECSCRPYNQECPGGY